MPIEIKTEFLLVNRSVSQGRKVAALRVHLVTGLDSKQRQQLLGLAEHSFVSAVECKTWLTEVVAALPPPDTIAFKAAVTASELGYFLVRADGPNAWRILPTTRDNDAVCYGVFQLSAVSRLNRWLAQVACAGQDHECLPQFPVT